MAESITIKALQDASLDAKSLEEVVNGNESKQVTTRKGETYPSVKKAIKMLLENGGAMQSAGIYETIADGLSGTADDEYFWVYPNSLNSIDNPTLFKRVDAMTEELLYVHYNLYAFLFEEGADWEVSEL